jgi:copper(I)-binding protein
VDSPISDDAQLHEHVMSAAGAMKMQQVPSVVVPAGKDLTFAPAPTT